MYNILLFYCSVSEDFIIFRNRNRLNKYLFFFSVRFMYSTIWGQWKFQTAKFNVQKKLSSERSADFLKRKRNTFQEVNKLMGNADGHENSRRDRKARDRDVFIGFLEKRKKIFTQPRFQIRVSYLCSCNNTITFRTTELFMHRNEIVCATLCKTSTEFDLIQSEKYRIGKFKEL